MAGIELGKAFVQIVPSAQGISGSISNLWSGEVTNAGKNAGETFAEQLKGTLKKALAGFTIGSALKKSLDIGGDLQQSYIGGLDTLYGDAADAARDYARAAAEAGISMNTYSEQAVSFGAALKQSFDGAEDAEVRAMEAANIAILDMADNSAKMGTSMESIQNAYQGFAKGNYTMLDNLKLGYGGTRSEMERLLEKASTLEGAMGKTFDIDNLADVYEAIHLIQEDLGLSGVAADEAKQTLTGSFNAMKAAAENFAGSLMIGENVVPALETLVGTVKTYLINNLLPAIGTIFSNIPELLGAGAGMIDSLAEGIAEKVPVLIQQGLEVLTTFSGSLREKFGTFVDAGLNLIQNIIKGIVAAIPNLVKQAPQIISNFAGLINDNAPKIMDAGKNILKMLWEGVKSMVTSIKENWRSVLNALLDVWEAINWVNIGKGLINGIKNGIAFLADTVPGALKGIATTAWEWFKSVDWLSLGKTVITFIWNGISNLASKIPGIVKSIATTAWEWFKGVDWLSLGKTVITTIVSGLVFLVTKIPQKMLEIGKSAWDKVKNIDWLQLGKDIINGIIDGIKNLASSLWDAITGAATGARDKASDVDFTGVGRDWMDGLSQGIESGRPNVINKAQSTANDVYSKTKATLRESSPSKASMELGRWWSEGLGIGIEKGAGSIYDAIGDLGGSMDARMYNAVSPMAIAANASSVGSMSTIGGQGVVINNNITVDGAEQPEEFASRLVRQLQIDMRSL